MPKRIDEAELFRVAVAVFAESGYRATTTQEIARRAGVNEVTLFRRYGDKASLINAALTTVLADTSFARVETTDDVHADLVALVRAYAQTAQTYGGAVMTLLTDASRYPELREAMTALIPNLLNAARLIEAHQGSGHLAQGDPMQKVVTLIAPQLVSGLWARAGAAVPGPPFDPDAFVAEFLNGHRAD
jgi:AcrR family transcriptional regulator